MADTVRYLMEQMVPELEDMVKQKYFSKEEVKQIVKRRQDFEYLLKRKATLKEDFLRYIEYESKLDALRAHRRQALGLEDRKKKSMSDFAMVRRIHFIFERAVRKFKTDLGLWTAWLEFCRNSNSNRRLGRVVARALHIHPTEPGLWVYAAAWEFEANGNPNAARALLQQGLRMCKYSQKMWLDVFDMELMYVEKEVARRRILGLDVPGDDEDSTQQQQQQQDGQEPATGRKRRRGADAAGAAGVAAAAGAAGEVEDGEGPESKEEAAAAAEQPTLNAVLTQQQQEEEEAEQQQEQQQGGLAEAQAAVKAVLNGAIARLVYQNALKAAAAAASKGVSSSNYLKPDLAAAGAGSSSSSLEFRAGFLRVLGRYTSPGVRRLQQEIVEGIRQDFPADPAAADLLARITCDPSDTAAPAEAFQTASQEFQRLLGHPTATAAAAADTSSKGRSSKRQKKAAAVATAAPAETAVQEAAVPREVVPHVYRLYCGYVEERLQALLAKEEQALGAAAVAQQLFKLLLSAHAAGAAEEGLYSTWVRLATQLQQSKIALKAARLATEAHPSSAAAWEGRIDLEAQSLGCSTAVGVAEAAASSGDNHPQQQQQQQQQLLGLVVQAVQQVPAAGAVQLWETGFNLAESLAAAGSTAQLAALQKQLLSAVTAASVRGPETGGLGAVAGRCLQVLWRASGIAAARKLWQRLLLLPPAGGDMFRAMVLLEQSAAEAAAADDASDSQQQRRQSAADVAKRVRGVYEAWAAAYGGVDADLWVEWALFEQQQSKAGAGKLYWRAVKALDSPEDFIAAYRQQIGAA